MGTDAMSHAGHIIRVTISRYSWIPKLVIIYMALAALLHLMAISKQMINLPLEMFAAIGQSVAPAYDLALAEVDQDEQLRARLGVPIEVTQYGDADMLLDGAPNEMVYHFTVTGPNAAAEVEAQAVVTDQGWQLQSVKVDEPDSPEPRQVFPRAQMPDDAPH